MSLLEYCRKEIYPVLFIKLGFGPNKASHQVMNKPDPHNGQLDWVQITRDSSKVRMMWLILSNWSPYHLFFSLCLFLFSPILQFFHFLPTFLLFSFDYTLFWETTSTMILEILISGGHFHRPGRPWEVSQNDHLRNDWALSWLHNAHGEEGRGEEEREREGKWERVDAK